MRPDKDTYFLEMAFLVAVRATCARRKVGCVIVDGDGIVLATGYNGVPSGFTHCVDVPCEAAKAASGARLDECWALHAEVNAVAFCPDVRRISTCYTTVSPCVSCTKLLLNTGCRRLVFAEEYAGASGTSKALWESAGRVWQPSRYVTAESP